MSVDTHERLFSMRHPKSWNKSEPHLGARLTARKEKPREVSKEDVTN